MTVLFANIINDWNVLNLFTHPYFWCSFLSWIMAQMIKMIVSAFKTGRVDIEYLVSTGGMPSAHSAMVTGTFFGVGLVQGFGSPITLVALALASVTMFDAATVRKAAGEQAKIINKIAKEFRETKKIKFSELKELLGHTHYEVYAGMLTGILVSTAVCYLWRG